MLTHVVLALINRPGTRNYWDIETQIADANAAVNIVDGVLAMGLPDYFKQRIGTPIILAASGGDYAISLASVASVAAGSATTTGARQGVTVDLADSQGNIPEWVKMDTEFEFAATPTAGNGVMITGPFSQSSGAGQCGTLGTDSAFTGISNNIDASILGLDPLGMHICTSNATSTVQKKPAGGFKPHGRYWNPIVRNMAGAAFHSANDNQRIILTPIYGVIQDTESGS